MHTPSDVSLETSRRALSNSVFRCTCFLALEKHWFEFSFPLHVPPCFRETQVVIIIFVAYASLLWRNTGWKFHFRCICLLALGKQRLGYSFSLHVPPCFGDKQVGILIFYAYASLLWRNRGWNTHFRLIHLLALEKQRSEYPFSLHMPRRFGERQVITSCKG